MAVKTEGQETQGEEREAPAQEEGQAQQISDLLQGYGSSEPAGGTEETDPIGDDGPEEAGDGSDSEGRPSQENTSESGSLHPDDDTPEASESGPSFEELQQEISELREIIQQANQPEEQGEEPEVGDPETEIELPDFSELVTEEMADDLIANPHQVLTDLANKVGQAAYKKARVDTMRDVPKLVEKSADRTVTYRSAIDKFWEDNPDFRELSDSQQKYIGIVANEVESENPNLSPAEVLDRTAQKVRKDLRMEQRAQKREKERASGGGQDNSSSNNNPNFASPPGKGNRTATEEETTDDQTRQISAMLDTVT